MYPYFTFLFNYKIPIYNLFVSECVYVLLLLLWKFTTYINLWESVLINFYTGWVSRQCYQLNSAQVSVHTNWSASNYQLLTLPALQPFSNTCLLSYAYYTSSFPSLCLLSSFFLFLIRYMLFQKLRTVISHCENFLEKNYYYSFFASFDFENALVCQLCFYLRDT